MLALLPMVNGLSDHKEGKGKKRGKGKGLQRQRCSVEKEAVLWRCKSDQCHCDRAEAVPTTIVIS